MGGDGGESMVEDEVTGIERRESEAGRLVVDRN